MAVGLVDLPMARRQVPLTLDPSALDGHVMIVGAPRTGKTTVLASYAVQAARCHPASMLEFHVVDLGGGALAPLAALPNIGACVDGQDPASVRRVLAELERLLDERARQMRRHGVHDLARWRGLVTAGQVQGPAHTVLLLDQLVSFRERFADLDAVLGRLLVEGPSAGVHVAMTSARWRELPARRLEQVVHPHRAEAQRRDGESARPGRRGLGARRGPRPRPADRRGRRPGRRSREGSAAGDLRGAVHLAAALAGSRWPGQSAAPLRRLADLALGEWVEAAHTAAGSGGLLLGIAEARFEPVALAPGAGVAVLAYGDAGGGRSSMLARLVAEASALPSAARPQVYVLDYLGSLLETLHRHQRRGGCRSRAPGGAGRARSTHRRARTTAGRGHRCPPRRGGRPSLVARVARGRRLRTGARRRAARPHGRARGPRPVRGPPGLRPAPQPGGWWQRRACRPAGAPGPGGELLAPPVRGRVEAGAPAQGHAWSSAAGRAGPAHPARARRCPAASPPTCRTCRDRPQPLHRPPTPHPPLRFLRRPSRRPGAHGSGSCHDRPRDRRRTSRRRRPRTR